MSNAGFWDDFSKGKKSSGGKIVNLKLESDKTYQLRLVGDPKEFIKLFYGGKSVVIQSANSPLVDRYAGGKSPSPKYGCLVIDRADGVLKVVEVPATPLKPLAAWKRLKKREPGGENGCDWGIDVVGSGKDKRYTGLALDDSPLTEAEKKMIEEANIDLNKLYKAQSDEEAEARLLNKPSPAGQGGGQQEAPARPAATSSVGATTNVQKADIPF